MADAAAADKLSLGETFSSLSDDCANDGEQQAPVDGLEPQWSCDGDQLQTTSHHQQQPQNPDQQPRQGTTMIMSQQQHHGGHDVMSSANKPACVSAVAASDDEPPLICGGSSSSSSSASKSCRKLHDDGHSVAGINLIESDQEKKLEEVDDGEKVSLSLTSSQVEAVKMEADKNHQRPNLSAAKEKQQGKARIAVPVSRISSAAAGCGHQERKVINNIGHLRTRSKSSLDVMSTDSLNPNAATTSRRRSLSGSSNSVANSTSSLPRRTSSIGSAQPVGKKSADSQQKVAAGQQQQQQQPAPKARNRTSAAAAAAIRPAKSCSSLGFVTQIPTLISQSHAITQQPTSTAIMEDELAAAGAVVVPIQRRFAPNKHQQQQQQQQSSKLRFVGSTQREAARCKSMSELSATGDLDGSLSSANCVPPIGDSSEEKELPKVCKRCEEKERKVETLERDSRQMREQLNELEELENDSRLVSQKLEQKLKCTTNQLDELRAELRAAQDAEAKVRFQNKRLTFELRERFETIQQLQCQLSKLHTRLALAAAAAASAASSAGNANSVAVKSTSRNASTGTDQQASIETSRRSAAAAAGDSEENDHDSAIDLLPSPENKQPVSLVAEKAANAGDEEQVSCELDSAYSKSSASSSIGGDSSATNSDNDRSDSERRQKEPESQSQPNQSAATSTSSSGDESDHQLAQVPAGDAAGVVGRQQVHRKKISTARILRGIQVQQQQQRPADQQQQQQVVLGHARLARVDAQQVDTQQVEQLPANTQSAANQTSAAEQAADKLSLISQYKQEIASLRLRLLQAQTLNDNLVAELKFNQPTRQQRFVHSTPGVVQQQQQLSVAPAADRRSIIYVNGSQQPSSSADNSTAAAATAAASFCPGQSLSSGANCARHPYPNPSVANHAQQQQQQQQTGQQLVDKVDFLRSLLIKVHVIFQHRHTFELVNECLRLATNTLLASYSHQQMIVQQQQQQQQQQRHSLPNNGNSSNQVHQHLTVAVPDEPPVKAPPRKRSAASRMLPVVTGCVDHAPATTGAGGGATGTGTGAGEPQVVAAQQQAAQKLAAKETKRAPEQVPAVGQAQSALQVAKQTLFSIVPIYYNRSKSASTTAAPTLKVAASNAAAAADRAGDNCDATVAAPAASTTTTTRIITQTKKNGPGLVPNNGLSWFSAPSSSSITSSASAPQQQQLPQATTTTTTTTQFANKQFQAQENYYINVDHPAANQQQQQQQQNINNNNNSHHLGAATRQQQQQPTVGNGVSVLEVNTTSNSHRLCGCRRCSQRTLI